MHYLRHLLFALVTITATHGQCVPGCDFKLCSGANTLTVGAPDTPLSGALCTSSGKRLASLASTGEAMVDGTTSLSKYKPPGLKQPFAPSFFKAYNAQIGHQVPQQNQGDFIDQLCFKLPILNYALVNETANVSTNATASCIALEVQISSAGRAPVPGNSSMSEPMNQGASSSPPDNPPPSSPSPKESMSPNTLQSTSPSPRATEPTTIDGGVLEGTPPPQEDFLVQANQATLQFGRDATGTLLPLASLPAGTSFPSFSPFPSLSPLPSLPDADEEDLAPPQ